MATDLTPAEREDRESERLINRKRAPSRKHKEKRAPRHHQRRRRVREDDPDTRKPRSSSLSDDQLDKYLRDIEGYLRDDEEDDEDYDFDSVIRTFSDPDSLPGLPPEQADALEDLALESGLSKADWDSWWAKVEKDLGRQMESEQPPVSKADWDSWWAKVERDLEHQKPQNPGQKPLTKSDWDSWWAKVEEDLKPDVVADLLKKHDLDPARLEEMDRQLGLSATSYRSSGPMSPRTGAYHGVRDVRGNPTDSPNTVSLPDRRYFTNKDYDVIVKFAGKLLDEDWLKYGWDGGAKDAPIRAALDLAIQTANGNAYQSKIDSETYDLLLNRLAKWGYDTFSDTVLPMKAPTGDNRSASAMKNTESYKQIVRVASDLRNTHPVASLNILKSLRSLVSTEAEPAQSISELAVEGDPKAAVATVAADVATEAAVKVIVSAEIEAGEAAEIPLPVLLKVAASSAAAKAALGPFILAAAKKKQSKGKKKGKIPPQFLKNVKKKGDEPPKGKSKKASITAEDTSW